jgi:5S rRNA maturation endonuclease (ribonuclease M5)
MTRAEVEQLDRQIYATLADSHPQSVRHVFYEMTNHRLPIYVKKTCKRNSGYNSVQRRLLKMRRDGTIPYSWIADMSRRGYFTPTYSSAADFVRSMQGQYRADLWRDAADRCEIWCESRSIASVIMQDCRDLAVSLFPCGGYSSASFANAAAEEVNASADFRPLVILYLGDLDPHGKRIGRTLEQELRRHLHSDIEMHFRRIAITPEQVEQYDLPDNGEAEHKVEAEAMPAKILRQILRDAVEALLPPGALFAALVAEQSERAHLEHMARMLEGTA